MKKYIYLSLISILFFVTGFYSFTYIQSIILENLREFNPVNYNMTSVVFDALIFGVICGIVPIVFMFIWKKANAEVFKPKIISIGMFLVTIVAYMAVRIIMFRSENDTINATISNTGISTETSVESLHILHHIFMAMVLGFICASVYLKKKQVK